MNARETNFGSPSGEPSTTTTRPMTQQMCEKLWTLPIPFKEESGNYLHTKALKGAKSFALWPLSQAAQS